MDFNEKNRALLKDRLPRNYSVIVAEKLNIPAQRVRRAMSEGTQNKEIINALIELAEDHAKEQILWQKRFDRLKIKEAE